ncbi:PREDICTED: oxidative stress-induced growth inhibitor 2-like isoform X2 [Dinoponera quadriceps]|nr:PREDICTED: oxidative stress-induced growth inhibitor 2-like isoform X2 [Dinoponera quadriceps]
MQNEYKVDDNDITYKDVVIIGNGPSGICLSYMLAGNWPYYTGEPHPGDDMLTARLHFNATDVSEDEAEEEDANANNRHQCCKTGVVRATQEGGLARSTRNKLECLSSGIEGRGGGRPLALLMDQLQHPCVDAGLDVPSLLEWRSAGECPEHRIVDHVVLGKGQPGGAWQSMDPNVLTISLSRWMSLPDLDLRHWEKLVEAEQLQKSVLAESDVCAYMRQEKLNVCKTASRVSVGTVAAYYKDYVRRKGLKQYFRCGTTVTSIRSNSDSPENKRGYNWIVDGYENKSGKRFRYRCKRAVLATGTTDLSNQLGVLGEKTHDWVTHDLNDLETRLEHLFDEYGENTVDEQDHPVLVVGAGLSAADAIMAARFRGIPVVHAFRNSTSEWGKETAVKINSSYDRLQWLPSSIYPEYHKVYEMMADGGTNYPLYKSLPGYMLVSLDEDDDDEGISVNPRRLATLSAPDGQLHTFQVSAAAILIGYKPDLSYLEGDGIRLGTIADRPIDNKSNPIEIDDITYEVIKAPMKGLYALGPLVGDNFVRFVLGGAFGILAHILCTTNT